MFQISTEETYQADEVIFEEGNAGDWIYVIDSGSVEISKRVGGKKVVIEILKEGEVFGELGFITKTPRNATAQALEETKIGIIDRTFLDQEFNRLSGSFQEILRSLAMRLIKAVEISSLEKIRRAEPRIPKVLSLAFKSRQSLIDAFSENVSGGGIFIKTSKPLIEGERFLLKLLLPKTSEPIKIEGKVAWIRLGRKDSKSAPDGMGVEFIKINKSDRLRILKELKGG